ncbi:MAG: hypothetical protein LC730_05410 [Acidobacteria bacterium]|nr:hypothetical protein [Acidobacteriota bacterium]
MEDRVSKYDVTARDLSRGRNLRIAAFASPIVLAAIPAIVFAALFFIFGTAPPAAATILFLGLVLTAIGFFAGLALSGYFAYRLSNWTKDMRERIAADGIRAEEIDWFRHELSSSEKRALNLRSINDEANEMLVEAESRLHMIEAAAMRGSSIADSEIALKKLSARAKDLPLALEQAKISNEIRLEIESEEQP